MPSQAGADSSGRQGEQAVAEYLRQNGCFVIQCNYRAGRGLHDEIDIIACDGQYLIFAEVKTRSAGAMMPGVLAVTPQKQQRLLRCAQQFLLDHSSYACYQPRFDVACVTVQKGRVQGIDYYPNAFTL